MAASERTFIMIKPDGVERGLIADIIKRFEQKGFKMVAMKFTKVRLSCKYVAFAHHVVAYSPQRSYCKSITKI